MEISVKNDINLYDLLIVFVLAIVTNLFSEMLSWVLIYRKKKFKEITKIIDNLNKRIEVGKQSVVGSSKTNDKKVKKQESDLKIQNFEMMKVD